MLLNYASETAFHLVEPAVVLTVRIALRMLRHPRQGDLSAQRVVCQTPLRSNSCEHRHRPSLSYDSNQVEREPEWQGYNAEKQSGRRRLLPHDITGNLPISPARGSVPVDWRPVGHGACYNWYSGRRRSCRAITNRMISLVPSPMIISGASR